MSLSKMHPLEKTQEKLSRKNDRLQLETVSLEQVAGTVGTPCYVYSRAAIERRWHVLDRAFSDRPHQVCYAVKACSNVAILNVLAALGSGFDIVSGGELLRVVHAGGDPSRVVFSGVGKQRDEITHALDAGILCFNVESAAELSLIEEVAQALGKPAPIAPRINFDICADTHDYLSTGRRNDKFGVSAEQAHAMCMHAHNSRHLLPLGAACHVGSQLTRLAPFDQACRALTDFAARLAKMGLTISHIDVGGGLGVDYPGAAAPPLEDYIACLLEAAQNHAYQIVIEPGRSIIAPAGLLLSRILYLKTGGERRFAVVDAAMNDFLRPALYQASHAVCPVRSKQAPPPQAYDVVGPVCESADVLARNQNLSIAPGDLLAILTCGAYGFSMASQYNSRPLPAEVLVDGDRFHVIRKRGSIEDFIGREFIPGSSSP